MIKSLIKEEVKNLMNLANEDSDVDFFEIFGDYRRQILSQRVVTDDEFDDICKEVLDEIE